MRPLVCFGIKDDKKKVYSVSFFFFLPLFLYSWHGILYCMSRRFQTQTPKSVCVPVCCFACSIALLRVGCLVRGLARSSLSN